MNDLINGGDGADTIWGDTSPGNPSNTGGNDTLIGGAGNDEINGEIGDDFLNGETGANQLHVGDGFDICQNFFIAINCE